MGNPVNPQATRRVALEFDAKGNPQYRTVCSPTSFKQHALAILPPRPVIPVIFVPGIMGTNITTTSKSPLGKGKDVWTPPNGAGAGLSEFGRRAFQSPKNRQIQMSPDTSDVNPNVKFEVPSKLNTVSTEEAKRRGWGELHADSYLGILTALELALNDQYDDAGTPDATPMPVWKVAQSLQHINANTKAMESVKADWNPTINKDLPPLTTDEFQKLDDYYYPVWACGYNWLKSNEESADRLIQRIEEALAWYKQTDYFIPEGRVIVVSHSMGGLVSRRASQKLAKTSPNKIMGIVHGVQPVGGAPVVYRRFRAGTEAAPGYQGPIVATIIGWSAADTTCVLAHAPGPMELLPTKHFPPGWLKFMHHGRGTPTQITQPLPRTDNPYAEIYAKKVSDAWWGMIDEQLIDPAHLDGLGDGPYVAFAKSLGKAEDFHDNLGLYCHEPTYAYVGSDAKQNAFGSVTWETTNQDVLDLQDGLLSLSATSWGTDGDTEVTDANNTPVQGTANVVYDTSKNALFTLQGRPSAGKDNQSIHAGDGTVPRESGLLLAQGGGSVQELFVMTGFDHQMSYADPTVQGVTLYSIAKIIQGAKKVALTGSDTCSNTSSDSASSGASS